MLHLMRKNRRCNICNANSTFFRIQRGEPRVDVEAVRALFCFFRRFRGSCVARTAGPVPAVLPTGTQGQDCNAEELDRYGYADIGNRGPEACGLPQLQTLFVISSIFRTSVDDYDAYAALPLLYI